MYIAKRRSSSAYEIFEEAMYTETVIRIETESELRQALAKDQLRVHLQPIVDLSTGVPVAAELLLRWEHPDRGLIFPGDFIEIAEETGLIVPIGAWVLQRACEMLADWQQRDPGSDMGLTVNLSPKQLKEKSLIDTVHTSLTSTGADPSLLTLEITESVMTDDLEATVARLLELKGLGVKLAVDDFGTGYSSLSYLQNFPVDVLKIDRSFVSQMGADTDSSSLSRAIVGIGESLGLATIAEGVETIEQKRGSLEDGQHPGTRVPVRQAHADRRLRGLRCRRRRQAPA